MIPINKYFNSELVNWHYKAIKNYLDGRRMKNKFTRLQSLIDEFTGSEYTFETLVKAPFTAIENEIVPAWNNFPADRRTFYESSIELMGTLYNYLGNPHYYNFINTDGNTVYYNTNFLFSHLKLNVCPYCNENYTYYFTTNGKRNYDIDHYFSQTDYQILSLSFFNLVPSCKVCNFFKNADPSAILSPYYNYNINEILEWGLDVKTSDYLFDETQFEIMVKEYTSMPYFDRIRNNVRIFQLENRYALRKDIVLDTLKRKQVYTEDYIGQLFKDYEGKLFKNIEDLKTLLFNAYMSEEDYNKRPFSKLIRDVFNHKIEE